MSASAVIVLAIVCLTSVVVIASVLRRGGVRGVLRAWRVFELGIEIDATPPRRRRHKDNLVRPK